MRGSSRTDPGDALVASDVGGWAEDKKTNTLLLWLDFSL
jgi:hypothetical protein